MMRKLSSLHRGAGVGHGVVRGALCFGILYLATSCAEPIAVKNEMLDSPRFLRYTLRSQQSGLFQLAYRSNYLSFNPGFKPGQKCTIPFYSSQKVELDFNGVRCFMYYRDLPFPTDPDGMKRFIEKHFASTEEELNLGSLDKSTRDQIEKGFPQINMTKEQVFMAIGYPSHVGPNWALADDLTRAQIMEQNIWHYRYNEIMFIPSWWSFQFNNDGICVSRNPP